MWNARCWNYKENFTRMSEKEEKNIYMQKMWRSLQIKQKGWTSTVLLKGIFCGKGDKKLKNTFLKQWDAINDMPL